MPGNSNGQSIYVKYFDPVDSATVVNNIGRDVRKVGIYSGGYLTKVSDTSVSLSAYTCEISDGIYQVSATATAALTITVGASTPYVVMRWVYTGSSIDDYIGFYAVASGGILTNDVVVGMCSYTGSTLAGFDYTSRTTPNIFDLFLKAEPTSPASMRLMVRAGRVTYNNKTYSLATQQGPLFSAPGSNSKIDLLQVNSSGALIVTAGVASSSPVAPAYGGLVTLAEVTLTAGQTTITSSSISDVRNFITSGSSTSLLESVYPIGSIYTSTVSTNPNTLFGFGTWVAFGAGRVLVGVGTSDVTYTAGTSGGESTHTLTVAEMPSHAHSTQVFPDPIGGGSGSDLRRGVYTGLTGYTGGNGAHNNLQPYIVVYFWNRTA